jgi:hypothetical protein
MTFLLVAGMTLSLFFDTVCADDVGVLAVGVLAVSKNSKAHSLKFKDALGVDLLRE